MPYQPLDGSKRPVRLDGDLQLIAPNLRGMVTVHRPSPDRVRSAPALGTASLEAGLLEAGMAELATVELDVREIPGSPASDVRGPGDVESLELRVSRPDSGRSAVVLVQDQYGALSWHFPLDETNQPQDPVRAGEILVFRIPRRVVRPPAEGEPTRSLLGEIGKKLLKVIVFPLVEPLVGVAIDRLAEVWEAKNRAYRIRTFTPENYRSDEAEPLQPADWDRLQSGRALLFLHGTFSRAGSAFGGLRPEAIAELDHVYGGRLFAFDHYTLSHSPRQNVQRFLEMLPEGTRLAVDIICHSRGGLVARTLAEEYEQVKRPGVEVQVRRVIFVGVPNSGTALADPDHMVSMLDRYTTLLNLVPVPAVSQVLGGIATAVRLIGQGALTSLEGLMAMRPKEIEVNTASAPGGQNYYAITADFDPDQAGIGYLVKGRNLAKVALTAGAAITVDKVADDIFAHMPNDLVVPTDGVFETNGNPNFPISPDRLFRFDRSAGVTHITYFAHDDTAGEIVNWLTPRMAMAEPPGESAAAPPDEAPPDTAPPQNGAEPFRAYPDLQAPDQVEPGEPFYLNVALSRTEVAQVHTVVPMEVNLPAEVQQFNLQVRVMAAGFDAPQGWERSLPVDRANPDAYAVRIPLVARKPDSSPVCGRIWVHFFYGGTDCGAAYREVWIGKPTAPGPAPDRPKESQAIGIEQGVDPADITLVIADTSLADDIFTYALKSIHPDVPCPHDNGQFALDGKSAAEFTSQLMQEVQQKRNQPEVADVLQAKGTFIARLIEERYWDAIKAICTRVRAQGREPTLFIHSAELHIPWELAEFSLDPQRPPHLGAQVAMGRWYRPLNHNLPVPGPVMAVQSVAVVWSEYAGTTRPLKKAKDEAAFMKETFEATLLSARKEQVISLLDGEPAAEVFHFACHGETDPTYAGTARLDLEDGPITPDLVFVRKQDRTRPFVFLNVCQVGQAVQVLNSNAGFTGAFLEAHSRGCVAPLWEVVDAAAMAFVKQFYDRTLQKGEPVGRVLRDLRAQFAPGESGQLPDPTWMAYVYYGHPNLTLKKEAAV
jgi:hypothetical protein